jgi:hypothetical protein
MPDNPAPISGQPPAISDQQWAAIAPTLLPGMNVSRVRAALTEAMSQWRSRSDERREAGLLRERIKTWDSYAKTWDKMLSLIDLETIAADAPPIQLIEAARKEQARAIAQAEWHKLHRRKPRNREFLEATFFAWFREGGSAKYSIPHPTPARPKKQKAAGDTPRKRRQAKRPEPQGKLIAFVRTVYSVILAQPLSPWTARDYIDRFGFVFCAPDLTVSSPYIGSPSLKHGEN